MLGWFPRIQVATTCFSCSPANLNLLDSYFVFMYICCTVCVCVCISVFTLVAGLPARSQYSEGPATGHLDTGFSRFPCVYKQMLRLFPRSQVATTCFSCSPANLNLLDSYFVFMCICCTMCALLFLL